MKKPKQKETLIGLALAVLTFATAYLGVDKYQTSQVIVEAADIKVNVTSMPGMTPHTHPPDRTDLEIQTMIDRAVNQKMKDHATGGRFH